MIFLTVISVTVMTGFHCTFIEAEIRREHLLPKPDSGECVEETLVKVVRHFAAILDLPEHIADCGPRNATLDVHVVEMVLDKLDTRVEI